MMRILLLLFSFSFLQLQVDAQSADELIKNIKLKLEKVNTYQAEGTLKTNVTFIKAPVAQVKIYYKKPDKLKIINKKGISFVPKGSVNINLSNIFHTNNSFDLIDVGKDNTGLRIIKLLPKDDAADVILSTLYIDEKNLLIKKSKTTTKESGSYELEMAYGKFAQFGLPDKVVFSFNTKEYKMPKGVTLDYGDGTKKNQKELKDKKGKVEITYTVYLINKGIDDAVFK